MDVINHTPFPAQTFEAEDQHEQVFQVFVLKQTLSFAAGQLEYAGKQEPLCATERDFGVGADGVRQESDYCPFKPKCDVIVNAIARAPRGKPVECFHVRLSVVRGNGTSAKKLIEKTLRVLGERHFRKKMWPVRLLQWVVKCLTLTLIRPNPWKLTRAMPFNALPLRDEHTYGGQCRINEGERDARWVPKAHRLTPEQQVEYANTGGAARPVAHTVFEANPVGVGYAPHWYLKAALKSKVPAPRIELIGAELTAKQFWCLQRPTKNTVQVEPAGFGVRSKSHPARRVLLGKATNAFAHSKARLPEDFDFGYWNAAPLDQQLDALIGGDQIELVNLCQPDTPDLHIDKVGHAYCRLTLPEHECFISLHGEDGAACSRALVIDTVCIEPEEYALTLVWRVTLSKDEVAGMDGCEFCMRTFGDRDRDRHDHASQQGAFGHFMDGVAS